MLEAAGKQPRLWRCTQKAGELVYLPEGLVHGVHNSGEVVAALTTQFEAVGLRPVHIAARRGAMEELEEMLALPRSAHATIGSGQTALHFAARGGQAEAARRLIQAGAQIDATGDDGFTPLRVAVSLDKEDVVRTRASHTALPPSAFTAHHTLPSHPLPSLLITHCPPTLCLHCSMPTDRPCTGCAPGAIAIDCY